MKLAEHVSKSQEPRKSALGFRDNTPEWVAKLHDRGQLVEQVIKEYVPDVTTDAITVGDLERREQLRGAGLNEEQER
jgi:hypothetical protein